MHLHLTFQSIVSIVGCYLQIPIFSLISLKGLGVHVKPSRRSSSVYFRIGFGVTWLLQTRNGYLTTYLVLARGGGQRQCCKIMLAQELVKHVVIFSVKHVGRKRASLC